MGGGKVNLAQAGFEKVSGEILLSKSIQEV